MGASDWSLRKKRAFLYVCVAVNTAFMTFSLLVLLDVLKALISFFSCVISWVGILVIDQMIDLQKQKQSDYERDEEDD